MSLGSYNGRYAPLADGYQQARKRYRRSSSATSTHSSPLPPTNIGYENATSEKQFAEMNLDDKMNCMFGMMKNLSTVSNSVDSLTRNMYFTYANLDVSEARLRLLEYKSLDIETRLLKCNLLFTGLHENHGNENCLDIINTFLAEKLQIDTSVIKASSAYRLGRRMVARTGQRPRNRAILASFSDPHYTDEILKNARLLKGTTFGISRDYPREIREARKELWPEYKQARNVYGARNVQLQFPAALVINGDKVRDLFPCWRSVLQGSRNSNVKARVDEKFRRSVEGSKQTPSAQVSHVTEETLADESGDESSDTMSQSGDVAPQSGSLDPSRLNPEPGYLLSVHRPIQLTSSETPAPVDTQNRPDAQTTDDPRRDTNDASDVGDVRDTHM